MKSLLNQRGVSILQGMMLAAAVAGMAYVGTKMTSQQKLSQRAAMTKDNVEQMHDMIYAILQNKSHCTQTLNTNSLTSAAALAVTAPQALTTINTFNSAGGVAAAPFQVNTSGTYNAGTMYMNNTVAISSISISYPADFSNPAMLTLTYSKNAKSDMTKRSGEAYGGNSIKKIIPLKIQRNAAGTFLSCYGVSVGDNENLIQDFCQQIGQDDGNVATTDSLFEWSADLQQCVLKDLKCPPGEVFAGIDTNGARRCAMIQNWMNFNDLIDSTSTACNPATATAVRFVQVGDKVKIVCTPPPGSCIDSCDCPGSMDVCEMGTCVNRAVGCINGTYSKGDASCRFLCSGGLWSCPAPPAPPTCP